MIEKMISSYAVKLRKRNVNLKPSLMSYIEKKERELNEFLDVVNE
jgi:hypothetical protein